MADARDGYVLLAGSERLAAPGATLLGPASPNETMEVMVVVRRRPDGELPPTLDSFSKTQPARRRRMPAEEFAARHGASPDDVARVTAFAQANGLRVVRSDLARRSVILSGTVAQFSQAFGVTLGRYERPAFDRRGKPAGTERYRGREGSIEIPQDLEGIVVGVFGLDNRNITKRNANPPNTTALSTTTIAGLYNFPTNSAAGQTIGIVSAGGGYLATDISATFSGSPPTITDVSVGGTSNSGAADRETTQDICIAALAAPGAAVAVYFIDGSQLGWTSMLQTIAHPAGSDPVCSVISSSFYTSDGDDTNTLTNEGLTAAFINTVSAAFQDAATQGVTVCIASGDTGASSKVGGSATAWLYSFPSDNLAHVQYPGSDPWVLSVGGTTIGDVSGATFTEYVWNDPNPVDLQFWGTTGGGISDNFGLPAYQNNAGVPVSVNDNHVGRGVPDVAGNASGNAGYSGMFANGNPFNGNGTSASSPLWAGLIALINAALGQNVGFVNPLIYQLGSAVFNDIVPGAGPANNDNAGIAGYPAGAGWDACTGWGSPNGVALLNGLASLLFTQTFYFIVDKSSYGLDEVGSSSTYSPAFWLALEGFTPNAATGAVPSAITGVPGGITITIGAQQPADASQQFRPQRILYPCSVVFAPGAIKPVAQGGVFPAPGDAPIVVSLASTIVVQGKSLNAATELELLAGADPYFTNIDPLANNVFYLSQDLRIISVVPGINDTPISGVGTPPQLAVGDTSSFNSAAGFQYVQDLVAYLNANYSDPAAPGFSDPFASLFPDQGSALSDLSSVTAYTVQFSGLSLSLLAHYNFAVARVRMNGPANSSSNKNVRVFFRMFATQTSDTDYLRGSSYPDTPDPAGWPGSPLLGSGDPVNGYVTIPFFATGNYETNADHAVNTDYSADSINNQPIQIGASGSVWAYYGCYINIFPTANTINGTAVQVLLPSTHNCLVAQIAFDDAPILDSSFSPENCDKLAQRNLQITASDNPGPPATHRVPQTFDLRPGPQVSVSPGQLLDYPDELMIQWGGVPIGSKASIYWPQVNAATVLALADDLYSNHDLTTSDPHTIACTVNGGVTYVPIPPGAGQNFGGLFTVDLPPGVATGQEFTIVVRRLTTRRVGQTPPPPVGIVPNAAPLTVKKSWRYVAGTFAVRIPVTTPDTMRPIEENAFAVMKWRLSQMSSGSRWHPVLQRYLSYSAARVDGLGGDSTAIPASPHGYFPGATASGLACATRAALTALLLAALVIVIGVAPIPWLVILLLVLLLGVGFWWIKACHPKTRGVLRMLWAGIGSGAAVLAILLMLGLSAPLLIPTLGIGGVVFLISIVAALAIGCP